jgi:hypothetical protein
MTNHSESDDEIFALEEKCNINTNDQNIITKQDYVPEIAISVLANVVTKRYKYLRALIDSGSSSSFICKSSMPDPIKKKIKHDPSGETKWTTKGGTYNTTREANIWFQLTEFAPSCLFKHKFKVDRDAKSASYDIILGCDAMKELQFDLLYSENVPKIRFEQEVKIIASLLASGHTHDFTKYTFKPNSLLLTKQKKNSLRNNASAKHSIKQQTFANAHLIICHHKRRRNSMPCLTNIGSFSRAPLDSFPPSLFTSK